MTGESRVRGRGLAVATAMIVGATTVLYVWLIVEQGDVEVGPFALVVSLFLAALIWLIAALRFHRSRATLSIWRYSPTHHRQG